MDKVYIIVNKWMPTGGEIEATDIIRVYGGEGGAKRWLEAQALMRGLEVNANGYVLEAPLRGTDYNTYYIEDRDVE